MLLIPVRSAHKKAPRQEKGVESAGTFKSVKSIFHSEGDDVDKWRLIIIQQIACNLLLQTISFCTLVPSVAFALLHRANCIFIHFAATNKEPHYRFFLKIFFYFGFLSVVYISI